MKLHRGQLAIIYEMIDGNGQWIPAWTGNYQSTADGFASAMKVLDEMSRRADRRNGRIIYRPGYPTEHLLVTSVDDIERLVDTEWVDASIKFSLIGQLRTIASRGRLDDADVQVLFDAADLMDRR